MISKQALARLYPCLDQDGRVENRMALLLHYLIYHLPVYYLQGHQWYAFYTLGNIDSTVPFFIVEENNSLEKLNELLINDRAKLRIPFRSSIKCFFKYTTILICGKKMTFTYYFLVFLSWSFTTVIQSTSLIACPII